MRNDRNEQPGCSNGTHAKARQTEIISDKLSKVHETIIYNAGNMFDGMLAVQHSFQTLLQRCCTVLIESENTSQEIRGRERDIGLEQAIGDGYEGEGRVVGRVGGVEFGVDYGDGVAFCVEGGG
ncbi:hypothetical protein GQ457_01G044530 [Hibiscus cannabinus]